MKEAPTGWHYHSNGGGLVQDTATVESTAYVGKNAQVSGSAQVSGTAHVYGTAHVSGSAHVYGTAHVSGDAQVYGDNWAQSPLYIQGSRHALTNSRKGYIQIGCHEHTFEFWKKHGEAIARTEGYTSEQIEEYGKLVDLFIAIGK